MLSSPALRFGHGRATKEAYAEWLGLHARTHAELMWVAEEAVLASRELPTGWQTRADPQGRPYYLHEASGSSGEAGEVSASGAASIFSAWVAVVSIKYPSTLLWRILSDGIPVSLT